VDIFCCKPPENLHFFKKKIIFSEQEDHPRWVQHFRLACHPATTVGLHRHLACDRGFFNLVSFDPFLSK
jgi:hypothetical protein